MTNAALSLPTAALLISLSPVYSADLGRLEIQGSSNSVSIRLNSPQAAYLIEHANTLTNEVEGDFSEEGHFIIRRITDKTPWEPGYIVSSTNAFLSVPFEQSSPQYFRARSFDGRQTPVALRPFPFFPAPDSPLGLEWVFTNALPELDQFIRLRAPATTWSSFSQAFGGSPGAGGEVFYLRNDGAWVSSETVYTNTAFGGRITSSLPLAREGEWQLDFLLRDRLSRGLEQLTSERFLVAFNPRMRLRITPAITTPDRTALVELTLAAGQFPRDITLAAWVEMPDGRQLSLPTFSPQTRLLHTGPATNITFTLIRRHFHAGEAGSYRIQARMYEKSTGGLLARTEGRFEICAAPPVAVRGRVLANNGAPVQRGVVKALNVDAGTVVATSAINGAGEYALDLRAGRFILAAEVRDAAGTHHNTNDSFIAINCAAAGPRLDLQLGAVPQNSSAAAAAFGPLAVAPDDNALDGLPKPTVRIMVNMPTLSRELRRHLLEEITSLFREGVSDVNFLSDAELDVFGQGITEDQLNGEEADETANVIERIDTLRRAAGAAEFLIQIHVFESFRQFRTVLRVVDAHEGVSLRAKQSELVADGQAAEAAALQLAPSIIWDSADTRPALRGLFEMLRDYQDKPILPHLTLSVQPENPLVGEFVRITGTLREKNATGPVQPGKTVQLLGRAPGVEERWPRTTDEQGGFLLTVALGDTPGIGDAWVTFHKVGVEATSEHASFRVNLPRDLSINSTRVQLRPGETDTLSLRAPPEVAAVGRVSPTPSAVTVSLSSGQGILSATNVNLNPNDAAAITFTAGAQSGLATVSATYTLTNGGPPFTSQILFSIDGSVTATLTALPAEVYNGVESLLTGTLLVGGARLPGLPLHFQIDGPGRLNVTNALTDDNGQAVVTYIAPTNGTGAATVQLISSVGDQSVTNATSISFSPAPGCIGQGNAFYCIEEIFLPSGFQNLSAARRPLNNLGQVLYSARRESSGSGQNAFVWKAGINTQLGSQVFTPWAFNDHGDVVGRNDEGRAVFWRNGVLTTITAPLKSIYIAQQINNSGDVLVGFNDSEESFFRVGIWNDGSLRRLRQHIAPESPIPSPYPQMYAVAMNEQSQTLIYSDYPAVAYYILTGPNATRLPALRMDYRGLQSQLAIANAFNAAGHVLATFETPGYGYDGLIWKDGHWSRILSATTPGVRMVQPIDMNDHDTMVAMIRLQDDSRRAVLIKNGRATDLMTLIDPEAGWYSLTPVGINNRNQVLCKANQTANEGLNHWLLLTPTAPF
jgi:hypothetical protein